MELTVCLHELQLKFLLLMLNQNRTIWPPRAEIKIIIYSTTWVMQHDLRFVPMTILMTSFTKTYRVWIRQENISWFYISMSDSFWMKKFKSKGNRVNKRFDFTLRNYFRFSSFDAALQWSWNKYPLWWLIISHVKISNNHQKVRVEFENWSLKILEIFEFESLWSHLKNLEDFRDLEDDSKRLLMFQNSSFRIQCDSICPEIKPDRLTAPNKFKDKIKSVIVFKELHHVENIVRLLTLMINFDLAMNLKKNL